MLRGLKMVLYFFLVTFTSYILTYIIDLGLLVFVGLFTDITVLLVNPIFVVTNLIFGFAMGFVIAKISIPIYVKLLF